MVLRTLDKAAWPEDLVGHELTAVVLRRFLGCAWKGDAGTWRGSQGRGKGVAGVRVSPWRTEGGRGGLEGVRVAVASWRAPQAPTSSFGARGRRRQRGAGLGRHWAR